ncbi:hypothetical protein BU17DRAFT_66468 [Hysterangium stoloniferum]|nr:hypothetical protein BU17DRAFT_66468 [Hysterangium stoloniferum]
MSVRVYGFSRPGKIESWTGLDDVVSWRVEMGNTGTVTGRHAGKGEKERWGGADAVGPPPRPRSRRGHLEWYDKVQGTIDVLYGEVMILCCWWGSVYPFSILRTWDEDVSGCGLQFIEKPFGSVPPGCAIYGKSMVNPR